jgi:hypothetical protein
VLILCLHLPKFVDVDIDYSSSIYRNIICIYALPNSLHRYLNSLLLQRVYILVGATLAIHAMLLHYRACAHLSTNVTTKRSFQQWF